MVVLTKLGENSVKIDECPDLAVSGSCAVEGSNWVASEGVKSSFRMLVFSETSLPEGSSVLLIIAIFFKTSCASLIFPFMYRYLGVSIVRKYKINAAKQGPDDTASSHLHPNRGIMTCVKCEDEDYQNGLLID